MKITTEQAQLAQTLAGGELLSPFRNLSRDAYNARFMSHLSLTVVFGDAQQAAKIFTLIEQGVRPL